MNFGCVMQYCVVCGCVCVYICLIDLVIVLYLSNRLRVVPFCLVWSVIQSVLVMIWFSNWKIMYDIQLLEGAISRMWHWQVSVKLKVWCCCLSFSVISCVLKLCVEEKKVNLAGKVIWSVEYCQRIMWVRTQLGQFQHSFRLMKWES